MSFAEQVITVLNYIFGSPVFFAFFVLFVIMFLLVVVVVSRIFVSVMRDRKMIRAKRRLKDRWGDRVR